MHLTLWLLMSLAVSPVTAKGGMAVGPKLGVVEQAGPDALPGGASNAHGDAVRSDSCTNWRLTGPEHCRWMYRNKIDDYLACVRAIERACEDEERAQSER